MDRIKAMQVFICLAQTGSFTQTAQQMNLSRTKVTRYIETLENWLDTRLFHRTTRQVSLTSLGERRLQECQKIIHSVVAIERGCQNEQQDNLQGKIRLTCSTSLAQSYLIEAISQFQESHQALQVELHCHDSLINLTEQRIDLAIRISQQPEESLIALPLFNCHSQLVASTDYLAKHPKIQQPMDIKEHRCLSFSNFKNTWTMSQQDKQIDLHFDPIFTADEASVLLIAVLKNMGIAMLPTYLVAPYIERNQLIPLVTQWQLPCIPVNILYTSRKHMAPAVRAFIDFLSQFFKTQESNEQLLIHNQ